MGAPKADTPKCDVHGCNHEAISCSEGNEVDAQGLDRPAIPNLNTCAHHANWVHSLDATAFTVTDTYRKRT